MKNLRLGLFVFLTIITACDSYQPSQMPVLEDYGSQELMAINIATQKYPRTSTNFYKKGLILWNLGHRKEALASIARAVQMNDTRGEYHLFLARTYVENDSVQAAFEAAKKAESLGLDTLALNVLLADLYLKERQNQNALENIDQALAKNGDDPANHLRKGKILLAMANPEQAEQSLLKSLELDKDNSPASKALADIYLQREDYENALVYIQQNLAKTPNDNDFLYKKGVALSHTGQASQAIGLFRKVVTQDQNYEPAFSQLGTVYYQKRRYDSARYFANQALKLEAKDIEAMLTLARVADRKKGYWVALKHYEDILAIDSTYAPAVAEHKKLKGKIAWLRYLDKNNSDE
ncbi:MAG: tetratricopeptide repeat protein [Cyclobacteriaceae bacterium]|nr:tetratricopeptide repeat protein [Cyclobacteriaceae bacterium]